MSGTSKVTTMDVNEETFRIIYFSSLPFLDELTTDFDYTFGGPPRGTDEKVLLECRAERSSRSKVTILFVNENIFRELLHFPYTVYRIPRLRVFYDRLPPPLNVLFCRQHTRLYKYFLAFWADPFPFLVLSNELSCQSSASSPMKTPKLSHRLS